MEKIKIRVGSQIEMAAGDLGFGHTKAKRGDVEVSFPSITGPLRQLMETDLIKRDPLTHMIDHKRGLFVGDLALRQSSTKNFSLKESKADQEGIRSILEVMLGILFDEPGVECINLVSGLPVTFYFDQKKEMERLLKGYHDIDIQLGERRIKKSLFIQNVKLLPQPLGSAMDFLLHNNGEMKEDLKRVAAGKIGILDVGFFTNDLLVLDRMEIDRNESRSLRSGMSVAYKALSDAGIDLPIFELDQKVRAGQYKAAAEKAFAALAAQIIGEIETYWGDLDLVLVTGGGGVDLFPHLKQRIRQECHLMDQLSNVRGYHKAGRRQWK